MSQSNEQFIAGKVCENCSKPISIPPWALNKRFCCDKCRNDFHNTRTREAKELLADKNRKEGLDQL